MEKFNRFLPENPLIENSDFVIYGNDDLEGIKEDILSSLSEYKVKLLSFFNFSEFKKITINLFNDHDTYIEFSRQFYKPAPYSRGNFANGMINYCYSIKAISRLKRCLMHELAHILYQEIWDGKYDRVLWLDEGLAQYLSGEKNSLEQDDEKFKAWYLDRIVRCDKEIPKIEFLQRHGGTYGSFVDTESNKYNGYDLSYLMVRYIVDQFTDITSLLNDEHRINDLGTHILKDCIDYYNEYFHVDDIKQSFYDVETPSQLMDYLNKNIIYGWLDNQKNEHIGNLKGFRENCRISSIEEILSTRLGTCIEQAKLIKYFFDRIGLENKLYCYRGYGTEENLNVDVKMHCFVLFRFRGKWFHFEHSNANNRGIHEYESIESALKAEIDRRIETESGVLTEIPNIPDGLTFKQFNEYIDTFEPVSYHSPKRM